ncbi:type IV secretion system protein VirB6 [Nitrosomonas eutropha]|uniref:Type IV secretion system protein VirB6 n=1 Tax=Nitrosomonas eutropha TaxID=916 RepID=A0A1I7FBR0_9PROT|nr:type IV secretion system protein [Nitrosomonas eutropha]SFU33555.1 type IV secretion system protein VirB6 [Nitrosomonas eutropha]
MADIGVIEDQATKILSLVESWGDIPNTLIVWVTPVLVLGLTILIMWHGYKIVRGVGGQDHLIDVLFISIRAFLVFSLCLVAGTYASNVMGVATELREGLTGLFTGTDANIYAQLDEVMNKSSDAYKDILIWSYDHLKIGITGTDFTGLTSMIGGAFMVGFILVYAMVAAINMLIIDFSLAIIFAVGPLFIASLAFQGTAQFFNTWLGALLKYIFTAVVVTAIVGFGTTIVTGYANGLSSTPVEALDFVGATMSAVMASVILIFLTFKAAQIGADLSGGVALQLGTLAHAARWAINPAGAALSNTVKAAHDASKIASAGTGYIAGRASRTELGKAVGSSPAMKSAMAGINTMAQIGSGTRTALSHRSAISAARTGFQYGASVKEGTGTITK